MHNKNSNIQGRSSKNKSEFPYHKELLLKEKNKLPDSLREVPILKRDTTEENHRLVK